MGLLGSDGLMQNGYGDEEEEDDDYDFGEYGDYGGSESDDYDSEASDSEDELGMSADDPRCGRMRSCLRFWQLSAAG